MYKQSIVEAVINFFVGIVELILGLRVLFLLVNANPNAAFVSWIYRTSTTLISPFRGIFNGQAISRGHILDITALFAMLIYALLGYILDSLLHVLANATHHKHSS